MALDRFELGALLGEGAAGRVFRAVHRESGLVVALKTATPSTRREALGLERELAALAGLDHPAILHLYDHGQCGPDEALPPQTRWMALEYASQGSLEAWEPRDWSEVETALVPLLEGLAHAHSRGLIHRDLKPANVVRCAPGDLRPGVKIADFGLAWAVNRDRRGLVRAGSPAYMPPEQIRGQVDALGPWTDLYAMACVIWEWTTGQPPTGWVDVDETLRRQVEDEPEGFEPRFEVPAGLEPVLRALLAKGWSDRPQTAAHVLSALRRLGRVRRGRWFRAGPLPVPVHWQAPEGAPSTAFLSGAGLGLFALRDPAMVGRSEAQEALWGALRRVSDTGQSEVVALTGPPGIGRRRLGRWLAERAHTLGCADPLQITDRAELGEVSALRNRAGTRPLVVVDPQVAEAAADLAGAALLDPETNPLLVVLCTDDKAPALRALDRLPGFQRVALGPLSRQVLSDFGVEHLGLERGFADGLAADSDGNPGLLTAWVRTWVARGDLVPTDRGFTPRPGASRSLVPTLDGLRQARLDGLRRSLSPEEQLAAALGALLGREVLAQEWLPLLHRHGLGARHSPVRRLTQLGVVDPAPSGWVFRDPLLRSALVHELATHGDPATFHASAADVLADLEPTVDRAERRGRHLHAAGRVDEAWAVLRDSLEDRRRAADWVRVHALVELLDPGESRTELDAERQYILLYFGALALSNVVSAAAAVPRARALAAIADTLEDPALAGKARRIAAEVLTFGSAFDEARALLAHTDPDHPRMRTLDAVLCLETGDHQRAIARYEALYRSEHADERMRAANGLGRAYGELGDAERAEHWFGVTAGIDPTSFVPLINTATVHLMHGAPARALECARQAAELSRERTMHHRGYVALLLSLCAVAARDRTWLDRSRERALFFLEREVEFDPVQLAMASARARSFAHAEHLAFLDAVDARIARKRVD